MAFVLVVFDLATRSLLLIFCIFTSMIAVVGTYQNGVLKLDKEFSSENPLRVIVTFLDDVQPSSKRPLSLSDFSFVQSQQNLENFKGSLSDALIEERRTET